MSSNYKDFVININNLTRGVSQQGFGLILALDNEKNIPYTLVSSPADLLEIDKELEITEEDKIYKLVQKLLMQQPRPQRVAVFGKEGKATEALNELINAGESDWFSLVCTDNSDETIKGLAAWANSNDKIYYATTQNLGLFEELEYSNAMIGYHNDPEDLVAEGLAAYLSLRDPGSSIPKFKTIEGSKPANIKDTELTKLHDNNGFSYIKQKGINHISHSKATNGDYLDITLGGYFVKFRGEEELFLLAVSKEKIGYDNIGISEMTGVVRTVLNEAVDNNIILPDYELTSLKREEVSKNNRANRDYSGIRAICEVVGAVETATINIDFIS